MIGAGGENSRRTRATALVIGLVLAFSCAIPAGAVAAFKDGKEILSQDAAGTSKVFSYPGSRLLLATGEIRADESSGGIHAGLTRLAADGSVDRSFGNRGTIEIGWSDVLVEPSGKVLTFVQSSLPGDVTMTRLLPSGRRDRSFGRAGVATLPLEPYESKLVAVAIGQGGKVWFTARSSVVSKTSAIGVNMVGRLLADGRLDPSFGGGDGVLETQDLGLQLSGGAFGDIAVTPDGGVLVAIDAVSPAEEVVHLRRDGTLDTSFGNGGRAMLPPLGSGSREDFFFPIGRIAMLPDGGFVLAGTRSSVTEEHLEYVGMVAEFTAKGRPDSSFGNGGVATVKWPGDFLGSDFMVLDDGGILLAGQFQPAVKPERSLLAAARLTPKGGLDRRFGKGGRATVTFPGWNLMEGVAQLGSDHAALLGGRIGGATGLTLARVPLERRRAGGRH